MVQTNKILTVSYGTFSCTLEGFDDSFDTMKAIAEYFRDLAADDRYFGAEPPQPDAEMLARIAQKEIARQVEAHQDNNGILLRAAAPAAEAAPGPLSEAPTAAPQPTDVQAEAQPVEPAAAAPVEPVTQAPVHQEPEQVQDDQVEEPEMAAPQEPQATAPVMQLVSETPEVEIIEPEAKAPMESMADKLARIRAVVERNDAMVEEQVEDAEDLGPLMSGTESEAEDSEAPGDLETVAEEPQVEAVAEPAVAEPEETAFPEADDAPQEDKQPADSLLGADAFELTEAMMDSVRAATEEVSETPASDQSDTGEDDSLFADLAEYDDEESDENLLSDDDDITPRVLKVRRETLEQAIADSDLSEVAEAEEADADLQSDSSLSAEDEADLQAELDAVAAELADAQAALNPPDEELDDQTVVTPRAREGRTDAFKGSTPPVTRILAETEDRMEEPEGAMSREAYEHLRAAVQATQAENEANAGENPKMLEDHAYRDDLANVVKPRRPEAGAASRSQRPNDSRPAPLKLVAEQRIDADTILPQRGPIRPRRVAAEAEEAQQETNQPGGFAAFAQEVGAQELPELLEAAAAYMSFVEGWEQFSRPQLMTRVKQVEDSGFNREDGLRTFGLLLREGKIEKTSGGRFTASDRIGYRPVRKAVG